MTARYYHNNFFMLFNNFLIDYVLISCQKRETLSIVFV